MKNQNVKTEAAARAARTAQLIEAYLTKNKKATATEIAKNIGVAFIQVHQIAQKLVNEGKLNVKNKEFSVVVSPAVTKELAKKAARATTTKETTKETTKAEQEPTEQKAKNFGRDFSKLTFNGIELRKGKWTLEVMKQFIQDNPKMTYEKLCSLFPTSLVRTFGLFKETKEARKINQKGRQRYFQRADQTIELSDGKKISVTNQISKENLPGIMQAFKAAGARVQ